jgi:hypothetical protein
MEEPMKKTITIMKIIAVTLTALVIGAVQARAAVTVYADEVPSNAAVAASAPVVETNVPAAQTNLTAKSRSGGGNPDVRIDETGVHIGGPNPVDIDAPAWLRHGGGGRNVLGIVSVISPFVMVVTIVALAGYYGHRRTRIAHETLRAMIDKGMPITPELVAEVRSKGRVWGGSGSRLLPGLVMAGIGTALLVSGSGGDRKGGWIVLFIGLAFLVVWAVERKNQNNAQPPPR